MSRVGVSELESEYTASFCYVMVALCGAGLRHLGPLWLRAFSCWKAHEYSFFSSSGIVIWVGLRTFLVFHTQMFYSTCSNLVLHCGMRIFHFKTLSRKAAATVMKFRPCIYEMMNLDVMKAKTLQEVPKNHRYPLVLVDF